MFSPAWRGVLGVLLNEWCFPELKFFSVMVGPEGVRPFSSKTEALAQLAQPPTVGGMRAFLGLAVFLRDFVPNFSEPWHRSQTSSRGKNSTRAKHE